MSLQFEWDIRKAQSNLRKHRVAFEEAMSVFADPLAIVISDARHSELEVRLVTVGSSNRARLRDYEEG